MNEIDHTKFTPCQKTSPNLYGWWWTLAPFRENARALWGAEHKEHHKEKGEQKDKEAKKAEKPQDKKEEKKEEKKGGEDELDLFGEDDPAVEEEAKKQAAKRKEETVSEA